MPGAIRSPWLLKPGLNFFTLTVTPCALVWVVVILLATGEVMVLEKAPGAGLEVGLRAEDYWFIKKLL